jgi:hypothetical protein
MTLLIRKFAALVAVYSIALQSLLLAFATASQQGLDPFTIICSEDQAGSHSPSLPQDRTDCDACLVACNNAPALTPSSLSFSAVSFSPKPKRLTFSAEAVFVEQKHKPQESRAPPISS